MVARSALFDEMCFEKYDEQTQQTETAEQAALGSRDISRATEP